MYGRATKPSEGRIGRLAVAIEPGPDAEPQALIATAVASSEIVLMAEEWKTGAAGAVRMTQLQQREGSLESGLRIWRVVW